MSETSPLIPRATVYGRPSFAEKIKMFALLLPLPIVLVWTSLFRRGGKGLKRAVLDRALRYLLNSLNVRQLQHFLGTSKGSYDQWTKSAKVEPVVEEVGGITKLFWVGERSLDKVILYLHGGAFLLPPPDFNFAFLYHVRAQLRERGINVGVAMVQYTLVPEAAFPTPLKQVVSTINHLMELGVDPQNIQFIGDSAGGNLILQVLGHLLHPLEPERVPTLSIPAPFKGAYLMSPWVDLSNIFKTLGGGDSTDIITTATIKYWGSQVLAPVPPKNLDYVEANSAAEDWWKGVDAFVDRVLITAGSDECLKNEVIRFDAKFKDFHSNVKLVVQDGEVHNGPMLDFGVGKKNGQTTDVIIDWLTAGFQETTP